MTADTPPDEASDASTLLGVLADAAAAGFDAQFVVTDDGEIRCADCGGVEPVRDFDVAGFRRLEGASDPADMLIVVWGTCAGCGRDGVATIGYGPNASEGDVAAMEQFDLRDADVDGPGAGASN